MTWNLYVALLFHSFNHMQEKTQCLEATELNPHQSAYRKHHSTAVHSRSSHKCNRLTETILSIYFLDHSCAFDTVDHDILITRLSS